MKTVMNKEIVPIIIVSLDSRKLRTCWKCLKPMEGSTVMMHPTCWTEATPKEHYDAEKDLSYALKMRLRNIYKGIGTLLEDPRCDILGRLVE